MFIHFNMGTLHGEQWANPGHDPMSFDPKEVDCEQWAKVAKSAGMNYGVFTSKHHDGFCLWNSSVTDYDIASSSYDQDIVKQYADAFRKEGLKVGLYFSVWDRQHKIEKGNITPDGIAYLKTQLTELLSNYGEITCLVIDGWGSVWGKSPTFEEIPYSVLADHIHSIQPNCLVINHSCKTDRAFTQVVHYEATHGQHCPNDNTIPSQQGPTLQPKWFWEKGYETLNLKPLKDILSELDFCNSRNANYLLNAAPNRDGKIDENVVNRLAEVGRAWTKPADMTQLVAETKPNKDVVATATSYIEGAEPDKVLDADLFTGWTPVAGDETPSITLDFGKSMVVNRLICGERHGFINTEAFKIEAMVDSEWITIAEGESLGFHYGKNLDDISASKIRLTILKSKGKIGIAELTLVQYNR